MGLGYSQRHAVVLKAPAKGGSSWNSNRKPLNFCNPEPYTPNSVPAVAVIP